MNYLFGFLTALAALYALWIFYLAVMNLKHARDENMLTLPAKVLGYPVLAVGVVLNAAVNFTIMTALFLEIPQEFMVSTRLRRHNHCGSGWRQRLAAHFEPLLDPFDPSRDHI